MWESPCCGSTHACSPRHECDVLGPKLWRKLHPLPREAVGPQGSQAARWAPPQSVPGARAQQWRPSARRGEREAERSTRRAGKTGTCRQSRDGHVAATRAAARRGGGAWGRGTGELIPVRAGSGMPGWAADILRGNTLEYLLCARHCSWRFALSNCWTLTSPL